MVLVCRSAFRGNGRADLEIRHAAPGIVSVPGVSFSTTLAKHAILTLFAPASSKAAVHAVLVAPLVSTSSTRELTTLVCEVLAELS